MTDQKGRWEEVMKGNAGRDTALWQFWHQNNFVKAGKTLRIGYKWLHNSHFCKLPVPPEMQAPPGSSTSWWSAPPSPASHSTLFSPAPPCLKALFPSKQNPFPPGALHWASLLSASLTETQPATVEASSLGTLGGGGQGQCSPSPTLGAGPRGTVWQVNICISPMFCLVFF